MNIKEIIMETQNIVEEIKEIIEKKSPNNLIHGNYKNLINNIEHNLTIIK